MLNQIASSSAKKPCFWDYHVILIQSSKVVKKGKSVTEARVLDMDSRLPYSCTLEEYLDGTFNMQFADEDKKKYAPVFRVVKAATYVQTFYSDRMHMKQDGSWMATPPFYSCITTSNMKKNKKGHLSNLDDYIDMSKKGKLGEICTMEKLRSKFG